MSRNQSDLPWLFLGTNPDCARSADQGERIVADDLGRTFELELNGVVGKRANRAEFISDAQNDSRTVSSISDQRGIVGCDGEIRIYAPAGHLLLDDLLAADVTFEAQVAPAMPQAGSGIDDERRIPQMLELVAIGLHF